MNVQDTERIYAQLQAISGKFEELSIRITLPEVIADTELFRQLMQEHSDMAENAQFAKEYCQLVQEIEDVKEMLSAPEAANGEWLGYQKLFENNVRKTL